MKRKKIVTSIRPIIYLEQLNKLSIFNNYFWDFRSHTELTVRYNARSYCLHLHGQLVQTKANV